MEPQTETVETSNIQQLIHPGRFYIIKRYLKWVGMNVFGFGCALPLTLVLVSLIGSITSFFSNLLPEAADNTLLYTVVALENLLFGVVIGFCQWRGLADRRLNSRSWLLLNSLVWFVFLGILAIFNLTLNLPSMMGSILAGLGLGILQGVTQSYLLRKINNQSWWWISATVLGYICGFAFLAYFYSLTNPEASDSGGFELYFLLPIMGFIFSLISGLFLIWPIRWFVPQTER